MIYPMFVPPSQEIEEILERHPRRVSNEVLSSLRSMFPSGIWKDFDCRLWVPEGDGLLVAKEALKQLVVHNKSLLRLLALSLIKEEDLKGDVDTYTRACSSRLYLGDSEREDRLLEAFVAFVTGTDLELDPGLVEELAGRVEKQIQTGKEERAMSSSLPKGFATLEL